MKYTRVGKSGLVVSRASLGSWLTYGDGVEKDISKRIIHTAWENGITSFDTANAYNGGVAEQVMADALRDIPRTKIVLASKVFWPMGDGENEKGLSRKSIMEQVHASLGRMKMDYMDILYFHRYDRDVPLIETLCAVDDLITAGKVLYFGVSEWTAQQIRDAMDICDKRLLDRMIVNQPSYNLLNRYIEDDVLPTCLEYGVGQIVYSPLAQGMLTGKYRKDSETPTGSRASSPQGKHMRGKYLNDDNFAKVEKLTELSKECGIPMNHMCLAWIFAKEGIDGVIFGASKPEQIIDNLKAVDIALAQDVIDTMDEICYR